MRLVKAFESEKDDVRTGFHKQKELRELEIGAQEVVCSKKEGKRALTLKNPCEVQQHSDSPGYVICRIPRLKSTCLELQKNLDDKTLKSLQREEYELQRLTAQQGEIDAKVRPLKKQAIVSISDYKRTVDTMSRIQSHEGLAEQRKGVRGTRRSWKGS